MSKAAAKEWSAVEYHSRRQRLRSWLVEHCGGDAATDSRLWVTEIATGPASGQPGASPKCQAVAAVIQLFDRVEASRKALIRHYSSLAEGQAQIAPAKRHLSELTKSLSSMLEDAKLDEKRVQELAPDFTSGIITHLNTHLEYLREFILQLDETADFLHDTKYSIDDPDLRSPAEKVLAQATATLRSARFTINEIATFLEDPIKEGTDPSEREKMEKAREEKWKKRVMGPRKGPSTSPQARATAVTSPTDTRARPKGRK